MVCLELNDRSVLLGMQKGGVTTRVYVLGAPSLNRGEGVTSDGHSPSLISDMR